MFRRRRVGSCRVNNRNKSGPQTSFRRMAIDTPARLAILGAGPIGLEAALYARFLGYEVVVYERGDIAASVREWGHVRMFTPFQMNRTTLGLAAIRAHD